MNVLIFQPGKNAMQSGRGKVSRWVIEYENGGGRRPEPLMGWTASGDTLNQVHLAFDNVEEAVRFARGKGWTYTVLPPRARKVTPRNYTDNFKYVPVEKQS